MQAVSEGMQPHLPSHLTSTAQSAANALDAVAEIETDSTSTAPMYERACEEAVQDQEQAVAHQKEDTHCDVQRDDVTSEVHTEEALPLTSSSLSRTSASSSASVASHAGPVLRTPLPRRHAALLAAGAAVLILPILVSVRPRR